MNQGNPPDAAFQGTARPMLRSWHGSRIGDQKKRKEKLACVMHQQNSRSVLEHVNCRTTTDVFSNDVTSGIEEETMAKIGVANSQWSQHLQWRK